MISTILLLSCHCTGLYCRVITIMCVCVCVCVFVCLCVISSTELIKYFMIKMAGLIFQQPSVSVVASLLY